MAQILIFGDSITDGSSDTKGGWADRLRQYFWGKNIKGEIIDDEYYWLYNLGISADSTVEVLKRIEGESLARKADSDESVIFIFAIGINDSSFEGITNPQPRLKESEFSQNYQELVSFAKKYTDKVLCIGITPVDETKTNPIYDDIWYNNERIKSFNKVIKNVAVTNKVDFVELYELFIKSPEFKNMLIDGLHPNDDGHKWMYDHIKPHLQRLLA